MGEMIHLLIINKSSDNCETILNIFQEAEILAEYQQATTAKGALKALRSHEWNAVIVDSQMLDLSDLSISAISKLCPQHSPLILTGDKISEDLAVRSIRDGADHCLTQNRLRCLVPIVKRKLTPSQPGGLSDPPNERDELQSADENCQHEHYLIDAQNLKLIYGNSRAKQNLGYPTQELYELTLNKLYPDHTVHSLQKLIRPLLDGERSEISVCTWQKRKNGTLYPVELHLQSATHNASILSVSGTDLTDRKEEIDVLTQQRARADRYARKSQEQTRLMANVSHDLRTCLNSIILLSKNLTAQDSELAPKQLDYARNIHQSSTDLLTFVDEVLDLSKIQSAQKELPSEPVDIQAVCQKMENIFSPIAYENDLSFSYAIQDEGITTIQTNQLCIERILKNFLSNAFKFTQKGSVAIEIYAPGNTELEQHDIADPHIAFRVKDTGIGIPEEKQRLIFQRFQQAETTTQEAYGGSGLGLAICQDLTQKIGGTLHLQSAPGQGSTFTLYLPKKGPGQNQATGNGSTLKNHSESEIKESPPEGTVLLVDDCQMHNMALQEFLSYKIPNCISVSTAEETYQVIEKHFIDCLVLDMSLHDTDGYEIMTFLKTQKEYESIPIIIYTGKNLCDTEEKKLLQYADSVINKSVGSYNVLQNEILAILSENRQDRVINLP